MRKPVFPPRLEVLAFVALLIMLQELLLQAGTNRCKLPVNNGLPLCRALLSFGLKVFPLRAACDGLISRSSLREMLSSALKCVCVFCSD